MRDGKKYAISFDHGRVVGEMKQIEQFLLKNMEQLHFILIQIFLLKLQLWRQNFKEQNSWTCFLKQRLKVNLTDKRKRKRWTDVYHFEGGIKEYVAFLNKGQEVLFDEPIYVEGNYEGIDVEVALQYTNGYKTTLMTFANNIHTYEGGMHEAGFKTALTRVVNDYAHKAKILKDKDDNLSGEDIREGITAVVLLSTLTLNSEGQTKTKLGNSDARTAVDRAFSETFSRFLMENPVGRKIVEKVNCWKSKNCCQTCSWSYT